MLKKLLIAIVLLTLGLLAYYYFSFQYHDKFICGPHDFKMTDGYDAVIDGEYLSGEKWRLLNDDDTSQNKHIWLGTVHHYETGVNDDGVLFSLDGYPCIRIE